MRARTNTNRQSGDNNAATPRGSQRSGNASDRSGSVQLNRDLVGLRGVVTAAEELEPELAAIAKDRPEGLLVYPDMVLSSHPRPRQLGDFAIKAGIPTMHAFRFYLDAGGLISYGATSTEVYMNAAEQVAKILGGTQPGELPLGRRRE